MIVDTRSLRYPFGLLSEDLNERRVNPSDEDRALPMGQIVSVGFVRCNHCYVD